MLNRFWDSKSEKELRIIAVIMAVVLSALMILFNIGNFRRYRKSLIETEKGQLLTIARTIGTGLSQDVELEMEKIDLTLDSLEDPDSDRMRTVADLILRQSEGLYKSCCCIQDGQEIFSLGERSGNADLPEMIKEKALAPGKAVVLGKYQAESGWYEMAIGKAVPAQGGICNLVFAMDLNEVYRMIVSPVKIGEAGYSVVKDDSLAIIMHHAKNQIGMDALYDRQETYPDLDLTSLGEWLDLQRAQDEGTGLLESYVWDDPDLTAVQRIVAFTTINIRGERWIVNSTLPTEELAGPLGRMVLIMAGLSILYMSGIALLLVAFTSAISRAESQRREIRYLKEINRGMELVARKNDEIRHYQRVQSMGMMSSHIAHEFNNYLTPVMVYGEHIAHEFNNYLTPVMVYGELLESDDSVSEDNRAMLREMLKSVDSAAKLSRELLDFSRMDAGAKAAPIDLTQETKEAVSVVRQLAPAKIEFTSELTDQPAWVRGREGMMQHILMNLCKNAFHAMEKTEKKALHIRYTVEEAQNEAGRQAVLTVSDSGCGIKTDNLRDIFEPFYTTKGSSQGTGLGLSVVRSMVENAGGTIKVESEEGKGTTFIMSFPAALTKEMLSVRPEKENGQALRTICVCKSRKTLEPWKKWLDSIDGDINYVSHEAMIIARLQEDNSFCDRLIVENELETMSGIDLAQIVKRENPSIQICILTREETERQQWYLDNGILDEIRMPDDHL